MGDLEDVQFIFSCIREANREPREHPGLDRAEIEGRFRSVGLKPHPFLVDLYHWRNGIDYVNAFLYFLTLEDAFQHYEAMLEASHRDWKPSWFPFLDLNGDVWFCLDVESGELIELEFEGGREEILASDYRNYIAAVAEMFRGGHMQFNEDGGCFDVESSERWEQVAARHRVTSAWW